MSGEKKNFVKNLLATLFWLVVWHMLAVRWDNFLLLPTPLQVLRRMGELAVTAQFWQIVAVSVGRILLGALSAMALGVLLAVLTTASSVAEALAAPAMTVIQATPVASFAILVLLWMDRDLVPALICGMMVLPVVWNNVCAGIRGTDPQLLEMARVYRLPRLRILRRIYVPSVLPYFRAACSASLGLGWKAGVAAEVLTVPKSSIGRMISEGKLYMLTEDLFVWTLTVVLLSLLLQKVMLYLVRGGELHA
mgnify:FL=1